tara:strand:+ start:655 stop:1812 length:1158 start_codon:yes stop_codon:yes gene_type:complete
MNSKIKVLQVIPKLGYGGAEIGCYDLAHYLPENNCQSFIVTSGGDLTKYIKKDRVKLIRLPVHSKNPIIMLLNSILLTLIILFFNISIVHARSRAPAWSCLIATKITRRKFVTTFHGTYNFSNPLKKFYNSAMVRSDLVIAGSNFIFSHIFDNYGEYIEKKNNKLLVIFRGINTEYFSKKNVSDSKFQKQFQEWNIEKDKFVVLLPGRLTSWKGQGIFIEAINILNQQADVKPFTAIILGSDQGRKVYYKTLINQVAKYRLSQKIKFISSCKEMPVAYEMAHVVVSASIEPEAFGRVSVEAQSMEKPIVASNIGGSKETLIENKSGFLFNSGEPISLAEKLKEALNMSETTAKLMGQEGRKNVLKKFDVEKMCNSTITEYKKLIS